ncbi:MAG: DNA repair protein RecN [Flavobacteriales bacterium TMED191]|nr:MAG: DNA repair protein RecN [Flavobacteriales bacterium TMED191]|tara:strand:- start:239 stop:1909 length:1671 start_codon:yes stop_codon:yes gene_type:complete
MLSKLVITNYAIIDYLEIKFSNGFTTVSGETGSGKSIILSAINLLLGNKFNLTNIRDKSTKVIIEGVFNIDKLGIQQFFKNNDIDYENELIIRREFNFEGKSRSFVNDSPVKIKILKNLSYHLIDIHSQHENLLINRENYQIKLLDQFASKNYDDFTSLLTNYNLLFQKLKNYKTSLFEKNKLLLDSNYDFDFYKNLIKEVELLNFKDSEDEVLYSEYNKLNNINTIKATVSELISHIDESENSVINKLNLLNSKLSSISSYDDKLVKLYNRLKGTIIDIDDILMEIHTFNQNLSFDDSRLEYIQNRINSINSLEKKMNVIGVNGIITKINKMKLDLQEMLNVTQDIETIKEKINSLNFDLRSFANGISLLRKKSAIDLARIIENDLYDLGMSDPVLSFNFDQNSELLPNGYDVITLLFSANKGYDMMPINKIASGGEIARLMLCVKKHLFGMLDFSTIIFDEIDAGVSGEIGRKMGRILKKISSRGQVVCVTHLPQIASLGDLHYKVYKKDIGDSLITNVVELKDEDRVMELARMLSGDQVNEEAVANAKKMLDI